MFLQTTHMLKLYISLSCNYAVAFGYVFYFILGQICLYALVRFRQKSHLVRVLCFGFNVPVVVATKNGWSFSQSPLLKYPVVSHFQMLKHSQTMFTGMVAFSSPPSPPHPYITVR